jgi:solute carrier family 13 (sodium-dependent dicarboxylate transporter), member 2/3/5
MSGLVQDTPSQTGHGGAETLAWVGRLAAPPLALAAYTLLPAEDGLTPAGRATAAVLVLMAVLWMTEAMPLPATALMPLVLFPVVGVLPIRETAAAYAHEVIFLLMGGFMIGRAMERWNLHRRLALGIVSVAGTRPTRLVAGFMVATAFLSMWISNTATVVLMLPIGLSIVALVAGDGGASGLPSERVVPFATCLLLGIAYAASIGSVGTVIGTPPNLFLKAFAEERFGIEIGFAQWMAVGVPLVAVFLPIAWLVLTRIYPPGSGEIPGGRELIGSERAGLGPISRGEAVVLAVFVGAASAWVLREPLAGWAWFAERAPWIERVTDPGIAMAAALVLFAFPVHPRRGVFALDWEHARKLPWGVLILVGGGLSLAAAVQANGVDAWVGEVLAGLEALPTLALVAAIVTVVIFLTEVTSNTATAATLLPIVGGVAVAIGVAPLLLVVPAAVAASCAFMMPVATPPNAIVFASGHLTIGRMVRVGFWLNLIGVVLVTALAFTTATWVFGT